MVKKGDTMTQSEITTNFPHLKIRNGILLCNVVYESKAHELALDLRAIEALEASHATTHTTVYLHSTVILVDVFYLELFEAWEAYK